MAERRATRTAAAGGNASELALHPQHDLEARIGGVSSFAFMGTNAHVLAGSHDTLTSLGRPRCWQHTRFWPTVAYRMLMERVTSAETQAYVSVDLGRPCLSFLWDHIVLGRSIMPGAAYFEMASSASWSLCTSESPHAIVGISVPAPLALGSMSDIAISMHYR